jgi:hypothetical protein
MMTKYYYQAITENGSSVTGAIDADSAEGASSALVARGYIPQKITDASQSGIGNIWNELQEKLTPVKIPELILFTKQLRTLIRAGVPILTLLQVLEIRPKTSSSSGLSCPSPRTSGRAEACTTGSGNTPLFFLPCTAACSMPVKPAAPFPKSWTG